MSYVGKEGYGKDVLHVFRDAGTHSQLVLKGTFATLRITHGEKPHWSEAEQEHYRESDAEMDAKIAAKQAEVEFTRHCPLYLAHRAELLTHYKTSPTYVAGGPNPREGAKALLARLAEATDPLLPAFAEHMKSEDIGQLAGLLLAPWHCELVAKGETPCASAPWPGP